MQIVALDVDYRDTSAFAAGVWFRGWESVDSEVEKAVEFQNVAEYKSGEFYRRELPCLLGVLATGPEPRLIVIDGYVWLGDDQPGLGARLYESLGKTTPIIGVAKTRFLSSKAAMPICRGESESPLFVTAVGVDVQQAADWIKSMHGPFRVPTMLKRVDQLARNAR